MLISTLRKIIKAMGGQLEIRAILPSGTVRINQFEDVSSKSLRGRAAAPAGV